MSLPFPYLEGHLWPDLHTTLAAEIRLFSECYDQAIYDLSINYQQAPPALSEEDQACMQQVIKR